METLQLVFQTSWEMCVLAGREPRLGSDSSPIPPTQEDSTKQEHHVSILCASSAVGLNLLHPVPLTLSLLLSMEAKPSSTVP